MRAEVENAVELLRSGQPGDADRALELLQNTVFSFSMRVCGHREDAEDTAQEVLLKSIPYLEKFENAKALGVWLYTVARNRCWMSRRRSRFAPQQHLSLDELMPDASEVERLSALADRRLSPEAHVISAQEFESLKQAILNVPPQYRLVLVLHDIEELSTEEIAQVLGIKEGTVRVRLHRARLYVRKELGQRTSNSSPKQGPDTKRSTSVASIRSRHCRQIFSNLSNYLDGVLDDSLCEELERHMAGCKPCESFLANLRETVEALRKLPGDAINTGVAAEAKSRALNELVGPSASRQ